MTVTEEKFAAKVTELAAVCRSLEMPQIMMLRRMTLNDPESLKWATAQQLDAVFTVILTDHVKELSFEGLEDASNKHFDPWLPNASEEIRDQDRWLLHDLCKPFLKTADVGMSFSAPAPPPKVNANDLLADDEEEVKPFTNFNALLDTTVLKVLRKNLRVLAVNSIRPNYPPPFFNAPPFAECFLPIVQELILPSLHGTRLIKELAGSRDWSKPGSDARLMGVLQGGEEKQNPILYQWDARWDHFSDASQSALRAKGKADAPEKMPWPRLVAHGAKNEYIPADERFLWVIKSMLRWEPESMAEAWEQLSQMYIQEFAPENKHEQARDGSFRDGLAKWIDRMRRHGGEALALKAFFECPKCDKLFIHKLTQTYGMAAQRQLAVPLLIDIMESLPK